MLILRRIQEDKHEITDETFVSLLDENLANIISLIEKYGFQTRIVGGAVRDILLGIKPRDVDLITDASPDEIIYILSQADIEADSWGLKHGTIKAVYGDEKYEITSLDYQIKENDDGEIEIIQNKDWKSDAERRDFTINAMSLDKDGNVYDYFNGIEDLQNAIIRGLPDFEKKLIKDPVLIFRFFRMLSKFENPRAIKSTLNTVLQHLPELQRVKADRAQKELNNIKNGLNGEAVLKYMKKIGAFDYINLFDE